jgi:integrase
VKGQRYPITKNGLNACWRRIRAAADVANFRFHDFRHDLATKLLRDTGNLKLVQKVLNHTDIKSTARYAHVLDEDIAVSLDRVQKSRKKSRSAKLKVTPFQVRSATVQHRRHGGVNGWGKGRGQGL